MGVWLGRVALGGVGFGLRAGEVPVAVFYPSLGAGTRPTRMGPYRIAAEQDAPLPTGAHPLVVLSHGHAGSRWGHHDLAVALAEAGFVVAAVEHTGDSWQDPVVGGPEVTAGLRARQLSQTVTKLLADPTLGPLIDPGRIGVAGFSAGGATALVVAGAVPDFTRFEGYCSRHPDDRELCLGERATDAEPVTADPRVRAIFAMAPLGVPFDAAGLAGVRVPVLLAVALADEVLIPSENGLAVRDGLPVPPEVIALADADHYVFLAPCTRANAHRVPMLCDDPPGVDRRAVHAQLSAAAIAFFRRSL